MAARQALDQETYDRLATILGMYDQIGRREQEIQKNAGHRQKVLEQQKTIQGNLASLKDSGEEGSCGRAMPGRWPSKKTGWPSWTAGTRSCARRTIRRDRRSRRRFGSWGNPKAPRRQGGRVRKGCLMRLREPLALGIDFRTGPNVAKGLSEPEASCTRFRNATTSPKF